MPQPEPITSTRTTYLYECPECNQLIDSACISHQHENGEWILTSQLIAYLRFRKWDKIIKEKEDAT
jgi:hypothetical protein